MKTLLLSVAALLMSASLLIAAPKNDIVDTAMEAGSFETLLNAIKTADLLDTLKGEGPFTVFAPSDEAFKKFWPKTLENLCHPSSLWPT
ncbi:fasciclin domain-containing protein [Akkermansiaceae bacterium]|nr:fasciclin domain-containing protein [Akkermansiaceae bacterium]